MRTLYQNMVHWNINSTLLNLNRVLVLGLASLVTLTPSMLLRFNSSLPISCHPALLVHATQFISGFVTMDYLKHFPSPFSTLSADKKRARKLLDFVQRHKFLGTFGKFLQLSKQAKKSMMGTVKRRSKEHAEQAADLVNKLDHQTARIFRVPRSMQLFLALRMERACTHTYQNLYCRSGYC